MHRSLARTIVLISNEFEFLTRGIEPLNSTPHNTRPTTLLLFSEAYKSTLGGVKYLQIAWQHSSTQFGSFQIPVKPHQVPIICWGRRSLPIKLLSFSLIVIVVFFKSTSVITFHAVIKHTQFSSSKITQKIFFIDFSFISIHHVPH